MQRNNLLTKKYSKAIVIISFSTEKDRIKGVAALIRSPLCIQGYRQK